MVWGGNLRLKEGIQAIEEDRSNLLSGLLQGLLPGLFFLFKSFKISMSVYFSKFYI